MVSFNNKQNQTILLSSQNYEFPDFTGTEKYDKNWLIINIQVIDGQSSWENTDPFLLSTDWQEIAQWFLDLAQFKQPKCKGLGFIEPNLTFQLKNLDSKKNEINFDIELSLECRPSFSKEKIAKYSFSFTPEKCREIAEQCKKEYESFPERK